MYYGLSAVPMQTETVGWVNFVALSSRPLDSPKEPEDDDPFKI